MKRNPLLLPLLALLVAGPALADSLAAKTPYSHKDAFEHYEGTKTCLACHEREATTFFHSQHYQWKAPAPGIVDSKGRQLGKINTINDFCTSPMANWIGIVKNGRGDSLSQGCSKCHAGLGRLPEEKISRTQLENIDCLICHAGGYQRDLYGSEKEGWQWKPILWKNPEGLDSVSKRITLPKKTHCLRCHAGSGGGPNYKRGDLEYTLAEAPRDFDVHLSKEGADLSCIDCHAGGDHRVVGRGADLSGTDSPAETLRCGSGKCHPAAPHGIEVLDRHAKRVDCTVCHIPDFARVDATDMVRDWSKGQWHEDKQRWTATITLEKNVRPVLAWWNGKSRATLLGEAPVRLADGRIGMMLPEGSRSDPSAKIHAFKLHKGKMPVLDGKGWIVPIVVEEFFADGKIDDGVRKAALGTYKIRDAKFSWVDTVRYMGIFHEVKPAKAALACLDCHGEKGRVDWKGLGYDRDPMTACFASSH
jgi:hypothetical protein